MGKFGWYAVLIVVFGLIPGWIFFKSDSVLRANAIEATEPFAANVIPVGYTKLVSISGDGGKLYEFYASGERTKFSLLVSEVRDATAEFPKAPDQILKALVDRQHAKFTDQAQLAHFTQAYLGSAFDPQRAYNVSPLEGEIPAIRFLTNKGANNVLTGWRSVSGKSANGNVLEIALLAMKKNEPVSATAVANFVSTLKSELQPAALSPASAAPDSALVSKDNSGS